MLQRNLPSLRIQDPHSIRNPGRRIPEEEGFTLLELMIAVIIVAILASIATVAFVRHLRTGRIVDARTFISVLQARQETYLQQHGQYCDASGGTPYPALLAGEPVAKTWSPPSGSGWGELGAVPGSGHTYFSFDVRASSPANKHALNIGEVANTKTGVPSQPTGTGSTPHPWYYIKGIANFDGQGSEYTELWTSSARAAILTYNEGS